MHIDTTYMRLPYVTIYMFTHIAVVSLYSMQLAADHIVFLYDSKHHVPVHLFLWQQGNGQAWATTSSRFRGKRDQSEL